MPERPPTGGGSDHGDPAGPSPTFSVVVPTRDRPDLVRVAVASVLGQSVPDLEVIVVDDAGSVDLDLPDDARVRVVRREVDGGAGAARNTGAAAATGRYLAFLDDDDVWVPERLELALAGLARAPVAVCWTRYPDEVPGPGRVLEGDVADVILDGVTPSLDATALDRSVYVVHDESFRGSEDVEWWIRQAAVAPVATVGRVGAIVRRSSAHVSPEVRAARLADGRRLLALHRDWFRAHPRAAAMRWQRLGLTALGAGDAAAARHALGRSVRLRPALRPAVHLARAWLARPPSPPVASSSARSPAAPADPDEVGVDPVPARVLQVITDTDRRGAQVFATDLEPALEARGHAVHTVALAPGAGGGLGVEVLGPTRRSPLTLVRLRRRARRHDVVVAHGSTTLPMSAAALAGTGVPFVYRQISDSLFWAPDRRRRLQVAALLRRAAAVVALSEHQAAVLRDAFGVPADRLAVVPNGVPATSFPAVDERDRRAARAALALPDAAPVVLSISALVPEKGVDLVIDAAARLGDDVQLVVAGDGPARAELERRAAVLGRRASFTGTLAEARDAYAAADVLVLASRGGDSMPATLVEAAFCGVPVVATPVGSITEVVRDGDTGLVVPVDDVEALAAAVGRLLADPVAARALAVRARLAALRSFEINPVADGWDRVLRRTVARMTRR